MFTAEDREIIARAFHGCSPSVVARLEARVRSAGGKADVAKALLIAELQDGLRRHEAVEEISSAERLAQLDAEQEAEFTRFVIAKLKEEWLSIGCDHPDPSDPDLQQQNDSLKDQLSEAQARIALLEAERKFPASLDEKLSDYAGDDDPEKELTTGDLFDLMGSDPEGAQDVIGKLSGATRRRFTELLNVELAELEQSHGVKGENLKREAAIQKMLGLFARAGEV